MNSQQGPALRFPCPHCGGNVKVPSSKAGQKFHCPRCDAVIIAPGDVPSEPPARVDQTSKAAAPMTEAKGQAKASRPAPTLDDEYGISCKVCGTRLHVRRIQIGTTIKCPDCYSPVVVTEPPKRPQSGSVAGRSWSAADNSVDDDKARKDAAQAMLDKARVAQEQEEAEERERSAERFTDGLFTFLADLHTWVRLAVLAVWFQWTTTLLRWAQGIRISEEGSAILGQAASLVAVLAMFFFLITFLVASAACGLALVRDTSEGLRKIEHWPGINFLTWNREVLYIVNAGVLAALPGAAVGIAIGFLGVTGMVLYTAAASFLAMFPPMLLSMFESNSAWAPFSEDAWANIRGRPEPWKLAYLMTSVIVIAGLFGVVTSIIHGLPLGLAGAVLMVTCMMLYFRTVGQLFRFLFRRG